MPQRQFTKLWGLKKLKKIAQGLPSRVVGVAPYLVRPTDPHIRERDIAGSDRLLVRTDEKGKSYQKLGWAYVPRYSIDLPFSRKKPGALSRYVRMRTRAAYDTEKNYFDGNPKVNPPGRFKHLRHILVPTHANEMRHAENSVEINHGAIGIHLPGADTIEWHQKGNKWVRSRKVELNPMQRALLARIMRFIREGIRSKQIIPRVGRRFVLRYMLWKNNPGLPEFYDLQEYRETQEKKKKKKGGERPPVK